MVYIFINVNNYFIFAVRVEYGKGTTAIYRGRSVSNVCKRVVPIGIHEIMTGGQAIKHCSWLIINHGYQLYFVPWSVREVGSIIGQPYNTAVNIFAMMPGRNPQCSHTAFTARWKIGGDDNIVFAGAACGYKACYE